MKPYTKMMLMNQGRKGSGGMENRRGGYENNYNYREGDRNGMENRYRGNDGPQYNGGRLYPQDGSAEIEIENRFRDRRGREHYNNGRYAPMRNAYDNGSMNVYDNMDDRIPPVYENGTGYRYNDNGSRMIGFAGGGEMQSNYRMDATHMNRNELEHRGSQKQAGHAGTNIAPMDRRTAQDWVRSMKNADGSTGEHWTYDQTTQAMKQRNIDCDPAEFYAIMNAMWSDYGKVAEKFGVNNVEYWVELTKAFLTDKDAMSGKAALYYECIVKK